METIHLSSSAEARLNLFSFISHNPRMLSLVGPQTGAVGSVAFSPDGTWLAAISTDGTIWCWDVASGQPLRAPLTAVAPWGGGFYGAALGLVVRPDGRLLASGGADGTIQLWDLDPATLAQRACRIANRNLTRAEWRAHLGDLPYQGTCTGLPAGT